MFDALNQPRLYFITRKQAMGSIQSFEYIFGTILAFKDHFHVIYIAYRIQIQVTDAKLTPRCM